MIAPCKHDKMSVCYGCATSFGVFNKQLGCKNCGFAFCKKCLGKKTCIPKQNNEKAAVCNKCFDLLTGKIQPVNIEPPAAYTKRVLAASQTQQDHLVPRNTDVHCSKQTKGLSNEDEALAKRLENLKKDRKAGAPVPSQAEIESRMSKLREERNAKVPSDREMAERLALVWGQDPSKATQPAVLKPENRKMQQEQVDDLLSQICQEVEIDSHGVNNKRSSEETNDLNRGEMHPKAQGCATYNIGASATDTGGMADKDTSSSDIDRMVREVAAEMEIDAKKAMEDLSKDKELWNRVQRLKADRKATAGSDQNETKAEGYSAPESDEENEEEATKRVIQQLLEESRLEEAASEESEFRSPDQRHSKSSKAPKQPIDDSEMESDELPWCCICNNDAVLRCRGCDGDLYCQRCYREGHDRYDREEHQTIPYKQK